MSNSKHEIPLKKIFQQNLKRAMEENYPTAAALYRALTNAGYSISEQTVRDYCNGKALPTADKLLWLSEVLGKSMDWFMGKESASQNQKPDPIDQEVLAEVIRLIDWWAVRKKRNPNPTQKAEIIVKGYNFWMAHLNREDEYPEKELAELLDIIA
jgi:transcriptional regulator with XRE-family HTH domain